MSSVLTPWLPIYPCVHAIRCPFLYIFHSEKNLNLFATNGCNKMCVCVRLLEWLHWWHNFLCYLLEKRYVVFIVRRAGLLLSQQDFEWRWSVPLFQCLTVLEFSFILFDLCLLITFFNFIMNYVPIVTFWIFTYHKIWILSIMFCFIWSYWIIYFLACL